MFELTVLDYIYIGVILASTVWATVRGGVYETVATIAWIVAAISARFVSPMLDELFVDWFKLEGSNVWTLVSAYFIVFFVVLLLFSLLNQKLRDKIQESVMNITDHTLGVIFGVARGIVFMGIIYWVMLWYFAEESQNPEWFVKSRTRPIMQLTAEKLDAWFVPGEPNSLLKRDIEMTHEADEIYKNLIDPAVKNDVSVEHVETKNDKGVVSRQNSKETGYKDSERDALEKQLSQIENSANAE